MAGPAESLRLVLATNNLLVGGAQQVVATLARELAERGHIVAVVDLVGGPHRQRGEPEPFRAVIEGAGVPVYDFAIRSSRDVREWRRAMGWFRSFRPEIVHGHLWPADRWAALLGRRFGAATLTTKHETRTDLTWRARWTEALAARLLFDRVVAISGAVRTHLERYLHVPADRIVMVPNPVDATRFRPGCIDRREARLTLGLWPDEPAAFLVGYTGRLVARKGLSSWLEAAEYAARERPLMRFVVVGSGPEEAALKHLARQLGLGDRVRFAGAQADVRPWLAACDAYLFTPSVGEGLPMALLEAMAMALPIVASNVGVNRELLLGVGWLPEPAAWTPGPVHLAGRPFAEALVRLYDDAPARQRLGAEARARILASYDLPVVLQRQLETYHSLLASPQGRFRRPRLS